MDIEFLREEDILEVLEIEKACFSDPWTETMFKGELESVHTVYLKVQDNDRIIGYAGAWCVCGDADITNVAVTPEYRRRGIAKKLLNRLIEELILKNAENIRLEVRESNLGAIALYEKAGFLKIDTRKNYYQDKEDALILELKVEKK